MNLFAIAIVTLMSGFVNVVGVFSFFTSTLKLPETVPEISLDKYIGHWYQVYGAPANILFQGYGICITADYGLLDGGNISVVNKQLNEYGEPEQISGYAYCKNPLSPGKLMVHLEGVPVDGPYWIVKLGEIVNDEYTYSIITVPSGISLWVLARDVDTFMEYYDDEVNDFLEEYGFKYVPISQEFCESNGADFYTKKIIE
jgi:lipocalin